MLEDEQKLSSVLMILVLNYKSFPGITVLANKR